MSPARTTVERNVLVSDIGQVVGTIDIIPQMLCGKLDIFKLGLHHGGSGLVRLLVARLIFGHTGYFLCRD
jgi:hypothetical protein